MLNICASAESEYAFFGGVLVVVLAACVEMRYMREFKQGVLGEFFHWGSRIQASPAFVVWKQSTHNVSDDMLLYIDTSA